MYVRSKRIKGQTYLYLVKSERHGKKVIQKYIGYLGKAGGWKQGSSTERAAQARTPTGLEALAQEARKYKSAETFVKKIRAGVVLDNRSMPDMLRSPMVQLMEARRNGTFREIEIAKKLVEENIAALNQELNSKPFAPFYRLTDRGQVEFSASDINTITKGIYQPTILGKGFSTITPKEAKEFIVKIEEQIWQRDVDPLVGAEIIQLLEEIRSGQTLTDFYYQVRKKMNES